MPTERQRRPGANPRQRDQRSRTSTSAHEVLYGRNAVREALSGKRAHESLMIAEGVRWDARLDEINQLAGQLGLAVDHPPRRLMDDLLRGANHQGVALRTGPYRYAHADELAEKGGILLLLDHLQDPQNVGTLMRSAEAFGVSAVAIPKDRATEITPAVVNASAGAVELMSIALVTNLSRLIDQLRKAGFWIAGLHQGVTAVPLDDFDPPTPICLLVGAEGKGLSPSLVSSCDVLLTIPQAGRIDSLNAAVAGSIALYHLTRMTSR